MTQKTILGAYYSFLDYKNEVCSVGEQGTLKFTVGHHGTLKFTFEMYGSNIDYMFDYKG